MEKEKNKKKEIKNKDITNNELKDSLSIQNQQLKNSVDNFKRLIILLIILMVISVISQGLYFYAHKDMFMDNNTSSNITNQDIVSSETEENKDDEIIANNAIDYQSYIGTYSALEYRLIINEFDEENIDFKLISTSTSSKVAAIDNTTIDNIKIDKDTITFDFTDDNFGNSGSGSLILKDNDVIKVNTEIKKSNKEASWNIAINNTDLRKED
ncbi:MAG: hypothetical protein ACI4OT_02260 [Bacilli bacterium]